MIQMSIVVVIFLALCTVYESDSFRTENQVDTGRDGWINLMMFLAPIQIQHPLSSEKIWLVNVERPSDELNFTVRDYWDDVSGWRFQKLSNLFPPDIINKLKGYFLSSELNRRDTISWNRNSTGNFSVNSAYNMTISQAAEHMNSDSNLIWSVKLPNRINFFLWLLMHERIMCNAERKRRHLALSDDCHYYAGVREDIDHVIWKCPMAREVWKAIMPPRLLTTIFRSTGMIGLSII